MGFKRLPMVNGAAVTHSVNSRSLALKSALSAQSLIVINRSLGVSQ